MKKKYLLRNFFCLLVGIVLTFLSITSSAKAKEYNSNVYDNFVYVANEHGITLTQYIGDENNPSIPEKINGIIVNKIGKYCFYENNSITQLTIPKSISEVENNAIARCLKLEKVEIQEGISKISKYMFYGCDNLTYVSIPKSVVEIDEWAFLGCKRLSKVYIPNSVIHINDYAFARCRNLKDFLCPNVELQLGENVFQGSKNCTIYGNENSSICSYAQNNNIKYKIVDGEIGELNIKNFKSDLTSPQYINSKIKFNLEAAGTGLIQYKISILKGDKIIFEEDYSSKNEFEWQANESGDYIVCIKVKDDTGEEKYQFIEYEIKNRPLEVEKFETNVSSPQKRGTKIELSAVGFGGKAPYTYRFVVLDSEGKSVYVRGYNSNESTIWVPDKDGEYTLIVKIKDSLGDLIRKDIKFTIKDELVINSYNISPQDTQVVGEPVELSVDAKGGLGELQYRFVAICGGDTTVIQGYKSTNSVIWTPVKEGNYKVYIKVKDESKEVKTIVRNYQINTKLKITKINTLSSKGSVNSKVELYMDAEGGIGQYTYRFVILKDEEKVYVRGYNKSNIASWIPEEPGSYEIYYKVRDEKGNEAIKKVVYEVE